MINISLKLVPKSPIDNNPVNLVGLLTLIESHVMGAKQLISPYRSLKKVCLYTAWIQRITVKT